MPPQPERDPEQRAPGTSPGAKPRRRVPRSPYRQAGALEARPNTVAIPDGHKATIEQKPSSLGFLGESFSMDSLEFLRWMAVYFKRDLVGLRVLVHLMGSQHPGGTVTATQQEISEVLSISRVHVNGAIGRLTRLGLVHMPRRGRYQLNPAATLRGGMMEAEVSPLNEPRRKSRTRVPVQQLDLLAELTADPEVPEVFKHLSLPAPPERGRRAQGGDA